MFYPAIFDFLGKNFSNLYKIILLVGTLYFSIKNRSFKNLYKGDRYILIFFWFFTISWLFSAFQSHDNLTIILSQYSRYLIVLCLWLMVRQRFYLNNPEKAKRFLRFTYDLILVQILVTIAKLIIFQGMQIESIVGTVSHLGGAAGTSLPILGFIVLYIYKSGKLKRNDIWFILGLFLIGFLTGKRAIIFILPIVIAAFLFYIGRIKFYRNYTFGLLLIPFLFYLGLKMTPSLNPENKIWGSFNPVYAWNYAMDYQFGNNNNYSNENEYAGRGGSLNELIDKISGSKEFSQEDWFGIGFKPMYTTDYEEFSSLNLGINHKGAASGVFQSYVTMGYTGIITTILFFFSIIRRIKPIRIRIVFFLLLGWEYFLYTGLIFREPYFMFLVIFSIHYFNLQYFAAHQKVKAVKNDISIVPF